MQNFRSISATQKAVAAIIFFVLLLIGVGVLVFDSNDREVPNPSPSNGSVVGEQDDLKNNVHYGIIESVSGFETILNINIDEIELLSGEAAVTAVMQDFNCSRDKVEECVPSMNNDFYLRNLEKKESHYSLYPSVDIFVFKNPGGAELEKVSLDTFEARARDQGSLIIKSSPFKFEIKEGNIITKLEQVYTP
jgi:hypothetical protein